MVCAPYALGGDPLLTLLNHWWALWDFRDLKWNIGLLAPDRADSDSNDMQRQFARVRRPFAALVCAYVLVMWFDGPILARQDPLGAVGLLHLPILAGAALTLVTENRKANLLAPALFSSRRWQ